MKKLIPKKNKLVSIKKLYKSFQLGTRYTNVLKNVNLDIYQGEFVIVFGPSGCGKSTLLHSIMGLERPDGGVVKFEGFDMWKVNSDDRARIRKRGIGIMYQQQNWIKSLTVKENIAFVAQLSGSDKIEALKRADKVLEIADITNRASYITSELSAGEQQKAGFARAIVTDPKVVIADEPTGNLDVKSGEVLMELFRSLKKSGVTVVMVTHNPEYLKYADKVVFMLDGRIQKVENVKGKKEIDKVYKQVLEGRTNFLENSVGEKHDIPMSLKSSKEDVVKRSWIDKLNEMVGIISKFFFHLFILQSLFIIKQIKGDGEFLIKVRTWFGNVMRVLDGNHKIKISGSINAFELTEISYKNLLAKKTRTYTTIFGISLGIGFIVFLLSLGYGVERLIISEITQEHNMNQVHIMPASGSGIKLDENSVEEMRALEGITNIYPIINSARRASFSGANTDVVVYGIDEGYLESTSNVLLSGEYLQEKEDILELIVNTDYLATIGMDEEEVLGEVLILEEPFLEDEEGALKEVEQQEYVIVGVIEDLNPPVVYSLIEENESDVLIEYSQAQVVLGNIENISEVRAEIEANGFETSSVVDTIAQIEVLFDYVRLGLTIVGFSAFIISLVGMVNTLTVSLLERTREIGLMKSIGMESNNIRSLFITESMLMGFAGGVFGVIVGAFGGLLSTLIISWVSISNGGEYVSVSYIPLVIILLICFVSSLFGYITGLYPARRAVAMAPLDALRYE